MRVQSALVLLGGGLWLIVNTAYAQFPYPIIRRHEFRRFFDVSTGEDFNAGSTADGGSQFSGFTKGDDLEDFVGAVDDLACPQGDCGTVTPISSRFVEPSSKKVSLASAFIPAKNAKSDYLWSTSELNILTLQMPAQNNVAHTTISLTEPAISVGLGQSYQNANMSHIASLLTDIRAAQVSPYLPASQEYLRIYLDCLNKNIVANNMGYGEAQARCHGDLATPSVASIVPGGIPGDTMDFGDSPSYRVSTVVPLPEPRGKLTALLFNEEVYTNTGLPGTAVHRTIRNARNDFQQYFGDYEYNIAQDATSMKMTATYKRYDPVWLRNDLLRLRVHERWELMRIMLFSYCDWYEKHQNLPGQNNGIALQRPVNMWGDFYDFAGPYKISPNLLRDLSVPGFTFIPQVFDILFKEIEEDKRFRGVTPPFPPNCERFFGPDASVLPYCPFQALAGVCTIPTPPVNYTLERVPYTDVAGGNPTPIMEFLNNDVAPAFETKIPDLFKKMGFLAKALSEIELLNEAWVAELLVRNLSADYGAGANATLREEARKLIAKVARVTEVADIKEALKDNEDTLNAWLLNEFRRLDEKGMSAAGSLGQAPHNK